MDGLGAGGLGARRARPRGSSSGEPGIGKWYGGPYGCVRGTGAGVGARAAAVDGRRVMRCTSVGLRSVESAMSRVGAGARGQLAKARGAKQRRGRVRGSVGEARCDLTCVSVLTTRRSTVRRAERLMPSASRAGVAQSASSSGEARCRELLRRSEGTRRRTGAAGERSRGGVPASDVSAEGMSDRRTPRRAGERPVEDAAERPEDEPEGA